MRLSRVAMGLIILGIGLIVYSITLGEAHVALFVIFPVIYGEGGYLILGIFLMMIGMVLLFISPILNVSEYDEVDLYTNHNTFMEDNQKEKNVKYGGLIMIGPIPIIFGSNKRITFVLMIMGIFFALCFILFYLFLYHQG